MVVSLVLEAFDLLAIATVLWISLLLLGQYVDDVQNFLLIFFVGVVYLGWRFL